MGNKLQAYLQALKAKISANFQVLRTKLSTDVKELWQTDKAFVVLFGAILVVIKFRQALISLIVLSSKWLFESTEAKSKELQQKEDDANDEANQLIDDSNSQSSGGSIGDDWNK